MTLQVFDQLDIGGHAPKCIERCDMKSTTKILYNAECPVCSFEIDHYAAYSHKNDLPLEFEDLNQCDLSFWSLTADQAARRLYVSDQGKLVSGIPAFLVLWQKMPRYRPLAFFVGLPVIRQLAVLIYDFILAPIIYRWHLRRKAKISNFM